MKIKIILFLVVTALITLSFTFSISKTPAPTKQSSETKAGEPVSGFMSQDKL